VYNNVCGWVCKCVSEWGLRKCKLEREREKERKRESERKETWKEKERDLSMEAIRQR
jgi:hypothetical protein